MGGATHGPAERKASMATPKTRLQESKVDGSAGNVDEAVLGRHGGPVAADGLAGAGVLHAVAETDKVDKADGRAANTDVTNTEDGGDETAGLGVVLLDAVAAVELSVTAGVDGLLDGVVALDNALVDVALAGVLALKTGVEAIGAANETIVDLAGSEGSGGHNGGGGGEDGDEESGELHFDCWLGGLERLVEKAVGGCKSECLKLKKLEVNVCGKC